MAIGLSSPGIASTFVAHSTECEANTESSICPRLTFPAQTACRSVSKGKRRLKSSTGSLARILSFRAPVAILLSKPSISPRFILVLRSSVPTDLAARLGATLAEHRAAGRRTRLAGARPLLQSCSATLRDDAARRLADPHSKYPSFDTEP